MTRSLAETSASSLQSAETKPLLGLLSAILSALGRFALHLGEALHPEGESEVMQFIRTNGGVLTDDLEREISRRFGNIVE